MVSKVNLHSLQNVLPTLSLLLVIPLIIYSFIVLTGISTPADILVPLFTVRMFSGDEWGVSTADIILSLALGLLFVEVVKSTRTDAPSIINHGLSMLVFVFYLLMFVTLRGFSNSTFFLLTVMQFVDVVAGFTVTIVAAKRDIGGATGIIGTN